MTTQPEALRLVDVAFAARDGRWHTQADDELRRLHVDAIEAAAELRRLSAVEAQRDALLEALKSTGLFLHHCWCDVQMNDYSFEKLNQQMAVVDAAIKAVEGEKE